MTESQERAHSGLLLQALYPLGGKVPGLTHVPVGVRRATRRAVTAAAVRAHLARCGDTRLVAVTGSRGKTTLKDLLGCMLGAAGPTVRTRQNDNDLYGVPATLLSIRPSDRFAVVEAGLFGPGDLAWTGSLMRPAVAVFTGLGEDHLPAFGGDRAALAAEKRRLLERVPPGGTVIVPVADAWIADGLDARVVVVDDPVVERRWPHGLRVRAGGVDVDVALHGVHLAPLVALALAAAAACGVDPQVAAAGAAALTTPGHRLEVVDGPNGSVVLLDDTKSREAIALAVLATLGGTPAGRRIAVLGELMERPFTADAYAAVAAAAREHADVVVAVGRSAGPLGKHLDDLVVADGVTGLAGWLAEQVGADDVVLVHGSDAQHLGRGLMIARGDTVGCRVDRCRLRWLCEDCPHLVPGQPEVRSSSVAPPAENVA